MSDAAQSIRVEHLSHDFGNRPALRDVSFRTTESFVTLLGENGAGKSTLLRILAGELRGFQGQVWGEPEHFGYLPQSPQLPNSMLASEFVAYCAWLRGLPSRKARERADESLHSVGLGDRAHDRISSLSGGMRRRVAIAAACVSSPRFILLDEPMSGLDPQQRRDLRGTLKNLSADSTVVMATHVLQDVPSLSNELIMLTGGQLVFHGTLEAFVGPTRQCEPHSGPPSINELERAFGARSSGTGDVG